MPTTLEGVLARLRERLLPAAPWATAPDRRRQAAVLVPFLPGRVDPILLFIRRAEGLDVHSGQVAFPGGNRDAADAGPVATALREAQEEIGLAPDHTEVLGQLPEVMTLSTGYCISGVVALLTSEAAPRPDGREVAEIFTVPLARLADPTVYREEVRSSDGIARPVPYFHVAPYVIWGATGRIVSRLLEVLRS
jgi:8-oxo-dGTP pyrophosphatase MutT (NUDIX family)